MGLYEKYLMPRLLHCACGLKPIRKQREKVVPLATGRVLEIGIGSGHNLPYYRADQVECLWGLDPSREMWSLASKYAGASGVRLEFLESAAENIPLRTGAADCVVMTYTLCTVPEPEAALAEIARVLKPGGRLIFCEHGESPDPGVRRWQLRLNPLWRALCGGCNLHRPIPRLLQAAGFDCDDLQTMYIPGWKPACFNYWGSALTA